MRVKQIGYMAKEDFQQWRLEKGYSINKCARLLGLNPQSIRKYELGEIGIPRLVYLATLFDDLLKQYNLKGLEDVD